MSAVARPPTPSAADRSHVMSNARYEKDDYRSARKAHESYGKREPQRDYAGFGGTSGLQSEGSFEEAEKLLGETGGDGNSRVRTGWSKSTRYTAKNDKA